VNSNQLTFGDRALDLEPCIWELLVRVGHSGFQRISVSLEVRVVMTKVEPYQAVRFVKFSCSRISQK
jgi:hypothetical protein